MPVDSTHPQYDAALPTWSRARDVLAGEDAVKTAGEKYLPRLDSQSDEEYVSYRKRAAFFNATARTLDEYLDLVFRRAPQMSMPNPEPLTLFDNVYVDGSAELDEQRAQFGNYLASFEGSAH